MSRAPLFEALFHFSDIRFEKRSEPPLIAKVWTIEPADYSVGIMGDSAGEITLHHLGGEELTQAQYDELSDEDWDFIYEHLNEEPLQNYLEKEAEEIERHLEEMGYYDE